MMQPTPPPPPPQVVVNEPPVPCATVCPSIVSGTAKPWRNGTICTTVFAVIALFLIFIGLPLNTVMYLDGDTAGYELRITYYGATAKLGDTKVKGDLDDLTCGRGGAVRFAGALHYFAFFTSTFLLALLVFELHWKVYRGQLVVIFHVIICALLVIHNLVLGLVRQHADASNCSTVDPRLVQYGVGAAWGCASAGFAVTFVGMLVYLSARSCKCCCYDPTLEPGYSATTLTQQQQQQQPVVVGVAVPQQSVTDPYAAHPPQPMYYQPQPHQQPQQQPPYQPIYGQPPPGSAAYPPTNGGGGGAPQPAYYYQPQPAQPQPHHPVKV